MIYSFNWIGQKVIIKSETMQHRHTQTHKHTHKHIYKYIYIYIYIYTCVRVCVRACVRMCIKIDTPLSLVFIVYVSTPSTLTLISHQIMIFRCMSTTRCDNRRLQKYAIKTIIGCLCVHLG